MELASMDNYFDGIALKFAEQTNRKIVSFLGSGDHGNAYLTDDDKVIKITTDFSEYVESKKLIGLNPKHLIKIYNSCVIKSDKLKRELPELNGLWIILQEKVNHDEIIQKELFYGLTEAFEKKFNEDFFGVLSFYHTNQITKSKMYEYLTNIDLEPEWENYFEQVIEMIDELKKYNIKSVDYGSTNFGFRGNTLVYFDIGFGDEENLGDDNIFVF